MQTNPVSFISDLHLSMSDERKMQAFEHYCNDIAIQFESLYILGDLFEYWIGQDIQSAHQERVFNALLQASKHTHVFFVHGNREMLLPNKIIQQCGVTLLFDYDTIPIFNQRGMICHGDRLCSRDKSHLFLRSLVDKKLLSFIPLLPTFIRMRILNMFRKPNRPEPTNNHCIDLDMICKLIEAHSCQWFFHGHTHYPEIKRINLEGRTFNYISLPSWDQQPFHTIIECDGSVTTEKIYHAT
ncbi:MAG TPA: UDP-2,3-diacylglucosamine diphosphatase [Gammaproteobacteria bacterium]|nr:UDP-2,3-diacylglucosamine diphosphatase [Gammaproteobacteria bacterium]